MSKLRSVIRHEYLTIVKQPSFWIVMVAIPAIMAIVFGLVYLGNQSSSARIEELSKDLRNVAIIDQSGMISPDVVKAGELALSPADQKDALREQVRLGEKEALIVFPQTLVKDRSYDIFLSSNDVTKLNAVTSLANNILKTSVYLPLGSADVIMLAQNGAEARITTYVDGQPSNGVNDYVVPGLFVLLFYIIFAFSVGYMLSSVSEEKENRSMEMVLTYVKLRTLIVGKLLAVSLVTLTQVTFFGLLALLAFLVMQQMGNTLSLPFGIDLAKVSFEPMPIFFGAAYLIVGFLMFAGFMTTVAAAAPSSKEANNFSSVFFIGAFVPFYFVYMLVTNPENPVTQFLTFSR